MADRTPGALRAGLSWPAELLLRTICSSSFMEGGREGVREGGRGGREREGREGK